MASHPDPFLPFVEQVTKGKPGEANGKVIGEMVKLQQTNPAAFHKLDPRAAARKYGACPDMMQANYQWMRNI
jgi:hypothetical protein